MLKDIEIAQQAKKEDIKIIAKKLNIPEKELMLYGNDKAKLKYENIEDQNKEKNLILVTAINPTKAGEGKSTTTIGLLDALNKQGKNAIACLREPSMGPVFGLKGGACGGGYAQVIPMEDINLHFTGDLHAITAVNNLISAAIDNHIHQGNELDIDITNIKHQRAMDMNDRALRNITVAQGSKFNGVERKEEFVITSASEIMAILCLAKDIDDFKERVSKIIVAYNTKGDIVTAGDLQVEGAAALIMKDAINPNLVQTLEHNPVLIHGGPFANIAHGCNSLIATKMGLKIADYVVTEAGFGSDLGSEKFIDIKSRIGGLKPQAIVLVATIQALKLNAGIEYENIKEENVEAVKIGLKHLQRHIDILNNYNIGFVIAMNKFSSDAIEEIEVVENWCSEKNYKFSMSNVFVEGGTGGLELANQVIEICEEKNSEVEYIYDLEDSFEEKLSKIVTKVYGGKDFILSEKAQVELSKIKKIKKDKLMICVAKTPISLSDDPKKLGNPKDFTVLVEDIKLKNGAGFIVVLLGKVMTMPGLSKKPAFTGMDYKKDGTIIGLS